jgi:hypothetical protein
MSFWGICELAFSQLVRFIQCRHTLTHSPQRTVARSPWYSTLAVPRTLSSVSRYPYQLSNTPLIKLFIRRCKAIVNDYDFAFVIVFCLQFIDRRDREGTLVLRALRPRRSNTVVNREPRHRATVLRSLSSC